MGTTNQLFLNFPKIKADLVVDLDKFTITTMAEIKEASKMKSGAAIQAEALELQKVMKNHTSYEKKIFKVAGLQPRKQNQQVKPALAEMTKFNYRGADEEDINGLVHRNENSENELRTIVMGYLQKLLC